MKFYKFIKRFDVSKIITDIDMKSNIDWHPYCTCRPAERWSVRRAWTACVHVVNRWGLSRGLAPCPGLGFLHDSLDRGTHRWCTAARFAWEWGARRGRSVHEGWSMKRALRAVLIWRMTVSCATWKHEFGQNFAASKTPKIITHRIMTKSSCHLEANR